MRQVMGVMLATFNYILLTLLIIANASIVYLFVRHGASSRWFVKLLAAWVIGALIGYPSSTFQFRTASHMVIQGFPLMTTFQLEVPPGLPRDALPWVEYLLDVPPIMIGANMTSMSMLFACPMGVWFYLKACSPTDYPSQQM